MNRVAILAVVLASAGCSSLQVTPEANPCMIQGATYVAHFVELPNGMCGALPDVVMNAGAASSDNLSCESSAQSGCTTKATGCEYSAEGTDCTLTSALTFETDGSSARGLYAISCSTNNRACYSSYKVTITLQ